jgi:hypothetical protein
MVEAGRLTEEMNEKEIEGIYEACIIFLWGVAVSVVKWLQRATEHPKGTADGGAVSPRG